jgi:hypothetical protein
MNGRHPSARGMETPLPGILGETRFGLAPDLWIASGCNFIQVDALVGG